MEHFSAFPTWCQHLSARGLWLVLFACGFTLAVTSDQRVGWEPSPKKSVFCHLLGDRGQEERRAAHWEGRGGDRVPTLFKKSQLSASARCCVVTAAKRGLWLWAVLDVPWVTRSPAGLARLSRGYHLGTSPVRCERALCYLSLHMIYIF